MRHGEPPDRTPAGNGTLWERKTEPESRSGEEGVHSEPTAEPDSSIMTHLRRRGRPSFEPRGTEASCQCRGVILPPRSDFEDDDAMRLQPFPHSRPQAGFSLLPGLHALGRNDQTGKLVAVGRLDDPRQ